jgi:hypothetical protein
MPSPSDNDGPLPHHRGGQLKTVWSKLPVNPSPLQFSSRSLLAISRARLECSSPAATPRPVSCEMTRAMLARFNIGRSIRRSALPRFSSRQLPVRNFETASGTALNGFRRQTLEWRGGEKG